jgi:hypothetical protein
MSRRFTVRVAMLGAVLLLVASGCGSSGSTKSTSPAKSPSKAVTLAQVTSLLPAPADVGDGYKIDTSSNDSNSDDPALDAAAKRQCPASAGFFANNSSDPHVATRSYLAPDGRGITVELAPDAQHSADFGTTADLEAAIMEIAKCPTLSYTESDGSHVELKLSAAKTSEYGDLGLLLDLDITLSGAGIDKPIHMTARMRAFEVGTVGVEVQASGSIVPDTTTPIPYDSDAVERLSKSLADKTAALQR